jgi:large subunit ribosomal protein L9
MKVVLLENVAGLGNVGDIKDVANGYARNYLLPRGLAASATPQAVQQATARAQAEARRQARLDEQARGLAGRLDGQTIEIAARVGAQGRLFGSVTSSDIAEELSKLAGQTIDHHQVELEEPLRELGEYEVDVRLSRNVHATVQVKVVAQE